MVSAPQAIYRGDGERTGRARGIDEACGACEGPLLLPDRSANRAALAWGRLEQSLSPWLPDLAKATASAWARRGRQ